MAAPIDITALTLNAKEQEDFGKFVFERVFNQDALNLNHSVWTGVKMKEQIVFASLVALSGIKDAGTSRPNSGGKPVFTSKFWEPSKVGDTMIFNQSEMNSLFKAYFSKIQKYSEIYDIVGSDEFKFLSEVFIQSASTAINRLVWYGDKAVAASGAGAAGLIAAGNVKYFDAIDGLFKKIFDAVTAGSVKRYTIAKNAQLTKVLQALTTPTTANPDQEAIATFEGIWALADARLKADPNRVIFVSNSLFENYRQTLQAKGTAFDLTVTTEGFQELKWNGVPIRNMETIWDLNKEYFENNTTNHGYDKPHRAVFTVPSNIPIATLNEGDFTELESFYYNVDRTNYLAYGFTLDAQLLEGYMAVAAY